MLLSAAVAYVIIIHAPCCCHAYKYRPWFGTMNEGMGEMLVGLLECFFLPLLLMLLSFTLLAVVMHINTGRGLVP